MFPRTLRNLSFQVPISIRGIHTGLSRISQIPAYNCCSVRYFQCQTRNLHVTSVCNNPSNSPDDKKKKHISERILLKEHIKDRSKTVRVWHGISVADLAAQSESSLVDILHTIKLLKIEHDNNLSGQQASKIMKTMNMKPEIISHTKDEPTNETQIDIGIKPGKTLQKRPPVVTIMGHVDHGKTTLLDALRHSEIVKQEYGGITQHIGAFVVSLQSGIQPSKNIPQTPDGIATKRSLSIRENCDNVVTFLDTPGHAAFSAMRQRGANATDIVVLVVAADDGVMEQTVESIKYARNAQVPIIVAINKIDKVKNLKASIEHLKKGLNTHDIQLEEDGGEVQAVKISALEEIGIEDIKEAILAQAEMMELKSLIDGPAKGVVIESSVLEHRGPVATLLVQDGTLKRGDLILASDSCYAKVRSMFDEWGNVVQKCTPGFPIQVIGWRDGKVPEAGDEFTQVAEERIAKQIILEGQRRREKMESSEWMGQYEEKMKAHNQEYKSALRERRAAGIKYQRFDRYVKKGRQKEIAHDEHEDKKISLLLKCDVHGSMEAILNVFDSYPNDPNISVVTLDLVHYGVGDVTAEDIDMVSCFPNPVVYAFNLKKIEPAVLTHAKKESVEIRKFNVIYHLVDDVKKLINSKLPMIDQINVLGEAQVLQEFHVTERNKKIAVAGSRCLKGTLKKTCLFKLVRGKDTIADGMKIASLRHFKDEVELVTKDQECGIKFQSPHAEIVGFKPTDRLICYDVQQIEQKTSWHPPGF